MHACLDTASGIGVDMGCTADQPLCSPELIYTLATVETQQGTDEMIDIVDILSECYACQDTEQGNGTDLGCSPEQPYCVLGRDDIHGFGYGCSEYKNAQCIFKESDIILDSDTACSADFAVLAKITVALAGCHVNTINLTALATTMSSVMNVSACGFELTLESIKAGGSHLLFEAEANLTFGLVLFATDEAQVIAIINDADNIIRMAMVLALIEENVGDVVAVTVTAALLHPGSATSDPHFVTAHGSKFDFNGLAGHTYCIVTDEKLQVNARFMGAAPESTLVSPTTDQFGGKPDTRTWMDQVAILHGGDQVLVEAASPQQTSYAMSFGTVHVNGEPLLGRAGMTKLASGLAVGRNKTRVVITIPDLGAIEVQVVRADFWQPGSGPGRNFLNLQIKEYTGLTHAHGILGQSLGGGDDGAHVKGAPQEYETTSIFATDCFYNQFHQSLKQV
eukprot:jgi/Mesvir1/28271/Mv04798-RA.1